MFVAEGTCSMSSTRREALIDQEGNHVDRPVRNTAPLAHRTHQHERSLNHTHNEPNPYPSGPGDSALTAREIPHSRTQQVMQQAIRSTTRIVIGPLYRVSFPHFIIIIIFAAHSPRIGNKASAMFSASPTRQPRVAQSRIHVMAPIFPSPLPPHHHHP